MEKLVTCHLDLAGGWRGGQRQVYLLTTGLARRGHRTLVLTGRDTPLARRLTGTGVEVHAVRAWGEWDLLAARRVARLAQQAGAQILAAHASHPHGLALWARRFYPSVKVVVHRRVDMPIAPGRKKYLAPDAYIAISEAVRNMLLAGGVPAERIRVVSSGVPPHQPDPEAKSRLSRELGIPADSPWVGNIADLVPHKGHAHLLRAWPLVLEQCPSASLVIVGAGPVKDELANQAQPRQFRERHEA